MLVLLAARSDQNQGLIQFAGTMVPFLLAGISVLVIRVLRRKDGTG